MSGPHNANASLPPIPPYQPVVLTWDPSTLYPSDQGASSSNASLPSQGNEGGTVASSSLAFGANLHSLDDPVPAEAPPSYNVARVPNYPVTYTFSSLGPATGAMILVPPADSPDTRPLYHISVSHDPFFPHCQVTSVMQGGSANGTYIGGYISILGIEAVKKEAETVCIRECEHPMRTMFKTTTLRWKGMACETFEWYSFNSKRALKWTTSTAWPKASPSTCVLLSDPKHPKAAEFTPYDELRRRGDPVLENTLTVMPAGHPHFDDILISALLLERRRKMASSTYTPYQFN